MMKKSLRVSLIVLVALALILAACGKQTATPAATQAPAQNQGAPAATEAPTVAPQAVQPAKQIVFYNWSDYIDPKVYELFEKETGIKVVEDNFSSNEELLAKLQGGAKGYALIVPSDYTVKIMIDQHMLAPLDKDKIPNMKNIAPKFRDVYYDPGNKYCVPYQWGTTGIGYLSDKVQKPDSWSVFFDPDPNAPWYGRMTMLDDAREAFAAALVYLGYDINTTDEKQLEEAKQALIRAKKALSGYDSDTYEDLLASGENLIAHGWNGDFLQAQEDNENIAYTIPKEGGVIWVDNVCIPASATPEQKVAAEMFLDFILRPDIGAMISEYNYYATPNKAAEAKLDPDFLHDPAVYPPQEVMDKLQFIKPVGDAEGLFQRMWDEVKAAP
ncbi:MAG TPA: spermidine/putrescine ABC transporter substrate-binding protein [Chloroflexi bacterium]|nr:spermidine/putrescine ABC transporter substrate-binding protein [Chloroflexota bacterium]